MLKGRKRPLTSNRKRLRVCVRATGFDATAACRSVRTEIYLSCRIGFSLIVHTQVFTLPSKWGHSVDNIYIKFIILIVVSYCNSVSGII